MNKVIVLTGATATGKTGLAVELVRKYPLRIISVDSAMIYRGMNVGTGKPRQEILLNAPHALVDIKDPKEKYSVADFISDLKLEIEKCRLENKIPLLVGGTMMYLNALYFGLNDIPDVPQKIYDDLESTLEEKGISYLYQKLCINDPAYAKKIDKNDRQRIIRALAVFNSSTVPLSSFLQKETVSFFTENNLEPISFVVTPNSREQLHEQIEARFDEMLKNGLITEVLSLYQRSDLKITDNSIRCVGYRQVYEYLDNKINYEQMRMDSIVATRRLAKRQCTWLRKLQKRVDFVEGELEALAKIIPSVLNSMDCEA